jgi:hypothetical protein
MVGHFARGTAATSRAFDGGSLISFLEIGGDQFAICRYWPLILHSVQCNGASLAHRVQLIVAGAIN